jgi:hypothetical protein
MGDPVSYVPIAAAVRLPENIFPSIPANPYIFVRPAKIILSGDISGIHL